MRLPVQRWSSCRNKKKILPPEMNFSVITVRLSILPSVRLAVKIIRDTIQPESRYSDRSPAAIKICVRQSVCPSVRLSIIRSFCLSVCLSGCKNNS
jgi:hypothetical protein